jgi:hypothetical protein
LGAIEIALAEENLALFHFDFCATIQIRSM